MTDSNSSNIDLTVSQSFLELFARVAHANGERTAVLSEGRDHLSYAQLYHNAWRIAQALVVTGVGPETIVGICIKKSANYIASMLGVWLAGGAFLPLDPQMPKERLQLIVDQSALKVALVEDGAETVFSGMKVQAIEVSKLTQTDGSASNAGAAGGAESAEISPTDYASAAGTFCPDRLAYVIYTSGSTGRPKGVMVTHSGIVNFIADQIDAFRLRPGSRVLFFLSTNFDASISDIGTALLSGSTICIEPEGLLKPGQILARLIAEREISHADLPPSVLRLLDCATMPGCLKTIIIGGEACPPDVVRQWAAKVHLVNVYGPTEATVCTSLCVCDPDTWDRPLIGKAMKGVSYRLLDDEMQPVAAGTPAELYIGGACLARGYMQQPELTAKKFVEDNGERLYRTGDLIVECADGELQFLGRIDRQFKLRGMLIEPEEIEARLAAHPHIERAAVLKRPLRQSGSEKLIAFVACAEAIAVGDLKDHLAKALPKWMVPQIIEVLPSLPLTITGKIDLAALRELELSCSPASSIVRELSALEQLLTETWQQVLGLNEVGADDDFFALGGDSLNVMEAVVAAHIRGVDIAPSLFAAESTVSGIARALSDREGAGLADSAGYAMDSQRLREDIQYDAVWHARLKQASQRSDTLAQSPSNLFLTGASGFLGARLLDELLQRTSAEKMFCLVRAVDEEQALKRITQALALHGKELSQSNYHRVVPVCGNLERARLGLAQSQWDQLASVVDTVYHCAATVNMLSEYDQLRTANVGGTLEIVRFLAEGRKKWLHYASTLSVFVATDRNTGVAKEDDRLEQPCLVYGGYAQTKFAAELLLREAEDALISPISYYRFGLLTGDSATGRSAAGDFLCLFARGLAALGVLPEAGSEISVDITPIDFAAAAMARLSLGAMSRNQASTYHIANETALSLSVLVEAMQSLSIDIRAVAPTKFIETIAKRSGRLDPAEAAACLALCRCLGGEKSFERFRTMDLFQATGIKFDSSNSLAGLAGSRIKCPSPSIELLARYLRCAVPA